MNAKATDERYDKGMINYIFCFFLSNSNITSECIRSLLSSIIVILVMYFLLLIGTIWGIRNEHNCLNRGL